MKPSLFFSGDLTPFETYYQWGAESLLNGDKVRASLAGRDRPCAQNHQDVTVNGTEGGIAGLLLRDLEHFSFFLF